MSSFMAGKVGVSVSDRFLYSCSEVKEYFKSLSKYKLKEEMKLANRNGHINVSLQDGELHFEKLNDNFDPEHRFGERAGSDPYLGDRMYTQKTTGYAGLDTDSIADSGDRFQVPKIELLHFTEALIPEPIRRWTVDNCNQAEGSLNYGAVSAIIVFSNLIGYRCQIKPKRNPDWKVTPNLWGMLIGNPSERKSPVADQFIKPLRMLQGEEHQLYLEKLSSFKEHKKERDLAEKVKDKALKAAYEKPQEDVLEKAKAMVVPNIGDEPTEERLIVNDTTTEAVGLIMSKNTRTVLQYRDELSGFFSTFQQAGREGDRAFYLEAFQGDGSYSYDRIHRGSIRIECLSVGLFGTIQPGVLVKHLLSAKGQSNDGLAQRMQLSVFSDNTYRSYTDEYMDPDTKENAYNLIRTLADADFEVWGATNDPFAPIPYFSFSKEAQEQFIVWYNIMKEKERFEADVLMQGHLGKYYSLLPSLALTFFLIDKAAEITTDKNIGVEYLRLAEKWCEVLETHARKMYSLDDESITVSLHDKIRTYVGEHLDMLPATFGQISGNIRGAKAADVAAALMPMVENEDLVFEGKKVRVIDISDFF